MKRYFSKWLKRKIKQKKKPFIESDYYKKFMAKHVRHGLDNGLMLHETDELISLAFELSEPTVTFPGTILRDLIKMKIEEAKLG